VYLKSKINHQDIKEIHMSRTAVPTTHAPMTTFLPVRLNIQREATQSLASAGNVIWILEVGGRSRCRSSGLQPTQSFDSPDAMSSRRSPWRQRAGIPGRHEVTGCMAAGGGEWSRPGIHGRREKGTVEGRLGDAVVERRLGWRRGVATGMVGCGRGRRRGKGRPPRGWSGGVEKWAEVENERDSSFSFSHLFFFLDNTECDACDFFTATYQLTITCRQLI
jgi:hypothetical protein